MEYLITIQRNCFVNFCRIRFEALFRPIKWSGSSIAALTDLFLQNSWYHTMFTIQ